MYLEKTESERFWGTSEASDGPSETKVKRGSVKANIPGTLNKIQESQLPQNHWSGSHQVDLPIPYQQLVEGGNRRSGIKSTSTIHLTASHVKSRSLPASWHRLKIGYLVLYSRPHVPNEWMPSIGTLEFVPSTFGQTLSNPSVESSTKINQNPIPAGAL